MSNLSHSMQQISVCMATYNGEKYIGRQLDSILCQLRECDEVVISDDTSTDRTIEIIEGFKEPRIRILKDQKFRNPIYNFENAMLHARGEYIFLSDQDDLWMQVKVQKVLERLKHCDLVLSDCQLIDGEDKIIGNSFFEINDSGPGFWRNLHHNSYLGCCMAMSREVVKTATPFPKDIPMHDWWIGIVSEKYFRISVIDEPLVKYRRHGYNASTSGEKSIATIAQKIQYRYALLKGLLRLSMDKLKLESVSK